MNVRGRLDRLERAVSPLIREQIDQTDQADLPESDARRRDRSAIAEIILALISGEIIAADVADEWVPLGVTYEEGPGIVLRCLRHFGTGPLLAMTRNDVVNTIQRVLGALEHVGAMESRGLPGEPPYPSAEWREWRLKPDALTLMCEVLGLHDTDGNCTV